MKIKSINNLKSWRGKKVFLRVDFNVPVLHGYIKDDYKIRASLPTIKFLLSKGAKLIIASHLGEPGGKVVKELSLEPIAKHFSQLLGKDVPLFDDLKLAAKYDWRSSSIIMLENLRFWPGEKKDQATFAKQLASLATVYVNDAFAVSHRRQASVSAIKKYLPAYAGSLLANELTNLSQIISPQKPFVVLMGGAKIATKAPIIQKLQTKADQILLGGVLANTFLKFTGQEIGRSVFDADGKKNVQSFFKAGKLSAKIILPLDVSVKTRDGKVLLKKVDKVNKTDIIFDIGPETIALYCQYIKQAKTIVWNGPLGKFEDNSFKYGTLSLAIMIAVHSRGQAFGLVGGGETLEALKMTKMESYIDWISTGGGAMLAYLGGEEMPGLTKLIS